MGLIFKKILREIKFYFRDVFINGIAASNFIPIFIRIPIYKIYGINIKTKLIRSGCFFGSSRVSIEKGTFINYNCFFEATNKIKIGKNCALGMNVTFCNSNHIYYDPLRRAGAVKSGPIDIGNGCWIGARVIILPNVKIDDGCIIAAGAVVTKNCEPNGLYAGIPARRIRDLPIKNVIKEVI